MEVAQKLTQGNIHAQICGEKGEETIKIANGQRAAISSKIAGLGGNSDEAKKLQTSFNEFKFLAGKSIGPNQSQVDSAISSFLSEVGKALGAEIEGSLALSEGSKNARRKFVNKETYENRKSQSNELKPKTGLSEIRKLLEKIKAAYANTQGWNDVAKAQTDIDNIIKELEAVIKNFDSGDRSRWTKYSIGGKERYGLNKEDKQYNALKNILTEAQLILSIGSIAQDTGKVGELFGAAAAYYHYAKIEKSKKEVLAAFSPSAAVSGLMSDKKTYTGIDVSVRITGEDKSRKGSEIKNPFLGGKDTTENNTVFYHTANATDDKVDFVVEFNTEEISPVTFSMKNYINPSKVTLLKGNASTILAMYPIFFNHYIGLLKANPPCQEDCLGLMYGAAKETIGIHALIGGVSALNDKNNIITTPSAQYLVINDNTKMKGGVKVYSTKEIANMILKNVDSIIDIEGLDQSKFSAKLVEGAIDSRFNNISVELRVSQLRKSI